MQLVDCKVKASINKSIFVAAFGNSAACSF